MTDPNLRKRIDHFLETLRNKGFRLTNQRKTIIEQLVTHATQHPSVQDLLTWVQQVDSSVGMATVYRTVEMLVQMELITPIDLEEGFSRFEIPEESIHFHLFCRYCGHVISISHAEERAAMVQSWAREAGFELLPQAFEMCGVCEECRKSLQKSEGAFESYPLQGRGRGRGRGHGMGRHRRWWAEKE